MPRLRDATIPIGRKLYQNMLKFGNACVIFFGLITVLMSLEINPTPAFCPGWLLILLGGSMMLAGLTGFGGTTLPCCYTGHVTMMSISILGCGVFALVIFGQRAKVVASFKSTRWPESTVDHYLSSVCWLYLFMCIFEVDPILASIITVFALIARCIFQRLPAEQFETVEQTRDARNVSMGKIRHELGEQSDKVDRTTANTMNDKVKDKYAKWSHESWGDPH